MRSCLTSDLVGPSVLQFFRSDRRSLPPRRRPTPETFRRSSTRTRPPSWGFCATSLSCCWWWATVGPVPPPPARLRSTLGALFGHTSPTSCTACSNILFSACRAQCRLFLCNFHTFKPDHHRSISCKFAVEKTCRHLDFHMCQLLSALVCDPDAEEPRWNQWCDSKNGGLLLAHF